jgi:hypothetical protein
MIFDKNWIRGIMGGKGRPVAKDRMTNSQKKVINSKNIRKMFSDTDEDGVIDALDCRPKNNKKHSAYPEVSPSKYRVSDDSYFFGKQSSDSAKFKQKLNEIWSKD